MQGPPGHWEQMQTVLPNVHTAPSAGQSVPGVGWVAPQAVDITQAPLVVVQLPALHTHSSRHSGRVWSP